MRTNRFLTNTFFFNRWVSFACACGIIIFQFMRIANESILNHITSYLRGYEEGKYVRSNFENPKSTRKLEEDTNSLKSNSFLSLSNLALTSSLIYFPFLVILFRLGELYGFNRDSHYRSKGALVACIMVLLYFANFVWTQKYQSSQAHAQGHRDGFNQNPAQYQSNANIAFDKDFYGTTFALCAASLLCTFILGMAVGGLKRFEITQRNEERIRNDQKSAKKTAIPRRLTPG